MTTVILVRHGQSEANVGGFFAGWSNAELSALGKRQAEATADYIVNHYKINKVYASDLTRAFDTGKAVADRLGMDVIPEKGMREIFAGDWEMRTFDDLTTAYAEEYGVWLKDIGNAACPKGESVAELGKRIYSTVSRIAAENEGKTVLIATHATPVRIMECICRGLPIAELKNIPWVSNASVTELRYNDGKWEIIRCGYDEHLADMRSKLPANV